MAASAAMISVLVRLIYQSFRERPLILRPPTLPLDRSQAPWLLDRCPRKRTLCSVADDDRLALVQGGHEPLVDREVVAHEVVRGQRQPLVERDVRVAVGGEQLE